MMMNFIHEADLRMHEQGAVQSLLIGVKHKMMWMVSKSVLHGLRQVSLMLFALAWETCRSCLRRWNEAAHNALSTRLETLHSQVYFTNLVCQIRLCLTVWQAQLRLATTRAQQFVQCCLSVVTFAIQQGVASIVSVWRGQMWQDKLYLAQVEATNAKLEQLGSNMRISLLEQQLSIAKNHQDSNNSGCSENMHTALTNAVYVVHGTMQKSIKKFTSVMVKKNADFERLQHNLQSVQDDLLDKTEQLNLLRQIHNRTAGASVKKNELPHGLKWPLEALQLKARAVQLQDERNKNPNPEVVKLQQRVQTLEDEIRSKDAALRRTLRQMQSSQGIRQPAG